MRKAISHAPVYLDVTQSKEGSHTRYKINQSTTANIPAVNEDWITDWQFRDQKDPVMGQVASKARWIESGSLENSDFFAGSWLDESTGHVEAVVESVEGGWTAHQVSPLSRLNVGLDLENGERLMKTL